MKTTRGATIALLVFVVFAVVVLSYTSKFKSFFLPGFYNDYVSKSDVAEAVSNDTVSFSHGALRSNGTIGGNTPVLDFAIIGFPKTGTTFLLDVLGRHEEIVISENEFCGIGREDGEEKLLLFLHNTTRPSSTLQRHGIKCPTIVRASLQIEKLARLSKKTRLIVGVRHPVLWFKSFYNYRVAEKHHYNWTDSIPSPNELVGAKEWRDVSSEYAKFDVWLKQLSKVPMAKEEIKELTNDKPWQKRISPSPFKIFIYAIEQLHDHNSTRQSNFRRDLQKFLRLRIPFVDFVETPKVNSNDENFPEYMDICTSEFDELRHLLMKQGKVASEWISKKFITSDDVFVSDVDFFKSILGTWGKDPCQRSG